MVASESMDAKQVCYDGSNDGFLDDRQHYYPLLLLLQSELGMVSSKAISSEHTEKLDKGAVEGGLKLIGVLTGGWDR